MTERWTPGPVEWPSLRTRTHANARERTRTTVSTGKCQAAMDYCSGTP